MQKAAGVIFMFVAALAGVVASMTTLTLTNQATIALYAVCLILFVGGVAMTFMPRRRSVTDEKPKSTSNLWGGILVNGGHSNTFSVGKIEAVHPVQFLDTHSNVFQADEIIATEPSQAQIDAQKARDKGEEA